jgi:hypothetical protein
MWRWKRLFVFESAFPKDSNRKYRLFEQGKNSFFQSFQNSGLMNNNAEKNGLLILFMQPLSVSYYSIFMKVRFRCLLQIGGLERGQNQIS